MKKKILYTVAALVFLVEVLLGLSLIVSSDFSMGKIVLGKGYGEWVKVPDTRILERKLFL